VVCENALQKSAGQRHGQSPAALDAVLKCKIDFGFAKLTFGLPCMASCLFALAHCQRRASIASVPADD
jgi:hypothetical protein